MREAQPAVPREDGRPDAGDEEHDDGERVKDEAPSADARGTARTGSATPSARLNPTKRRMPSGDLASGVDEKLLLNAVRAAVRAAV